MKSEDYKAVFEASADGVILVDAAGRIRGANPSSHVIFGFAPGELIGREVDELVPDSARHNHQGHRDAYAVDSRARPMGIGMELSARRSDGTEFPVEISLSPFVSEGERLVVATVRDVTQRKRLRDFGLASLHAVEAERKRIARELHDDTAQRIAALLIRLRIIERDAQAKGVSLPLDGFREELSAAGEGVRRIARGLRPPELEDAGIIAAIRAHMRALRDGSGLHVDLEADSVDDLLDANGRLVLYRMVQEALANVARHSGVSTARVTLRRVPDGVTVVVEDQGRGFVEGTVSTTLGGGLGLIGMQERAAGVGGRVKVESERGKGTMITIHLPASGEGHEGREG